MHVHTHARTHALTHALTHARTHAHTHTHLNSRILTHTHTHLIPGPVGEPVTSTTGQGRQGSVDNSEVGTAVLDQGALTGGGGLAAAKVKEEAGILSLVLCGCHGSTAVKLPS